MTTLFCRLAPDPQSLRDLRVRQLVPVGQIQNLLIPARESGEGGRDSPSWLGEFYAELALKMTEIPPPPREPASKGAVHDHRTAPGRH